MPRVNRLNYVAPDVRTMSTWEKASRLSEKQLRGVIERLEEITGRDLEKIVNWDGGESQTNASEYMRSKRFRNIGIVLQELMTRHRDKKHPWHGKGIIKKGDYNVFFERLGTNNYGTIRGYLHWIASRG